MTRRAKGETRLVNCVVCNKEILRQPSKLRRGAPCCSHACVVKHSHAFKHRYVKPLVDRFWSQVKKTDKCWPWVVRGGRPSKRYGSIHIDGTQVLVHRLSWQLHYGAIPKGVYVLHRCDNPPCVRPSHLFLGTAVTNAKDAVRKGRFRRVSPRGQDVPASKLTNAQASEIIKLRRDAVLSTRQIAEKFGVTRRCIAAVGTQNWKHLMKEFGGKA